MEKNFDRYKKENDYLIVEVAIKNLRQLFNERDPAPFRERDLDPQFVTYIVSAVEEFSLRTKMKIRILTIDDSDLENEHSITIREAIQTYFRYEAKLAKASVRKRRRTARFFFLIGIITLFICLTIAKFISSIQTSPALADIFSVGFVIVGWVALWHPIEALLYDWWPIHEKQMYYEKIATMGVEITFLNAASIAWNQDRIDFNPH